MTYKRSAALYMLFTLSLLANTCTLEAKKYDYIIIGGAGTAGSVAARDLSSNSKKDVLVLNTGQDISGTPFAALPLTNDPAAANLPSDYTRMVRPIISIEGINVSRRSMIGLECTELDGCSGVNGGVLQMPPKEFFDDIVAAGGGNKWSYSSILNLWRTIEQRQAWPGIPIPPGHGTNGPVKTIAIPPNAKLRAAVDSLGAIVGASWIDDMGLGNVVNKTGIFTRPMGDLGNSPVTGIYERQGSYTRFVKPVLNRKNLKVISGALVSNIERTSSCKGERGKACFDVVRYTKEGESYTVKLKKGGKIIIAAGVFANPTILFHSGVGNCSMLKSFGVDCVLNIPKMGTHIQDHEFVSQTFYAPMDIDGFSTIGSISGAYYSVNRSDGKINMETAMTGIPVSLTNQYIVTISVLTKRKSHGELFLKSSDWSSQLNVSFGTLRDDSDADPVAQAFINTRNALHNIGAIEVVPGYTDVPLSASYEDIRNFVKSKIAPDYHTTGSTPMGRCDQGATVDFGLNLCGASNVMVASNSIYPGSPESHSTHAIALISGKRISQEILGF